METISVWVRTVHACRRGWCVSPVHQSDWGQPRSREFPKEASGEITQNELGGTPSRLGPRATRHPTVELDAASITAAKELAWWAPKRPALSQATKASLPRELSAKEATFANSILAHREPSRFVVFSASNKTCQDEFRKSDSRCLRIVKK